MKIDYSLDMFLFNIIYLVSIIVLNILKYLTFFLDAYFLLNGIKYNEPKT